MSRRTRHEPKSNARTAPAPKVCGGRGGWGGRSRRGVASVLAMMFLIIFGSLVAAMAIASQGNVRTAATHLHVMRAMSAADTGMDIALKRIDDAASRFVLSRSDIDTAMVRALWEGDSATIGAHTVLPPVEKYAEGALPAGLAGALVNRHNADVNIITETGFLMTAITGAAPAGLSGAVYAPTGWVYTPAVALQAQGVGQTIPPPAYQIRYAPLADYSGIRVIVDGIVFDYSRGGRLITRTVMRDIRLVKSVDHAVVSNSRVMLGKNVQIEGSVATRFDDVTFDNGNPIVMQSDFYGLDPALDLKLDDFYASLLVSDLDGDNRLRIGHPVEGASIPLDADYDGDGSPDGAFADITGDGFLDEFDLFIAHFDTNGDGRITLFAPLTDGTPADGMPSEFLDGSGVPFDADLALMIDSAFADRNGNGIFGFVDLDSDNIYDADTETLLDFDPNTGTFPDADLGYRDGFIDAFDRYAKVSGTLVFAANASDWTAQQGDYRQKINGPINPLDEQPPMVFEATDGQMPPLDDASFDASENAIMAAADGTEFWQQVADQLGVAVAVLPTWTTAMNPGAPGSPWFNAVYSDTTLDGRPDNYLTAYWEAAPFNAPAYTDMYYRPVFRNMVFKNVEIPVGVNGLFDNCTFVGATYVRSAIDNTHPHWNEYGAMNPGTDGFPTPRYPRYIYGDDPLLEPTWDAPSALPAANKPPSENVLMTTLNTTPLDKGDVKVSEEGALIGLTFAELPEPLMLGGERIIDTKPLSNNIRFHDCLFVGSIVSDQPQVYTQVRNKLQFTGATRFTQVHPDEPANAALNPDPVDVAELVKSSMMLPNYSVDLGAFNSPPDQQVVLTGAIVAGVLDARGNTDITGTLLLTFRPQFGVLPLLDPFGLPVGNPAGFNTTLGYFGINDGDQESVDPNDLPLVAGVPIVGWDTTGDGLADVPYTDPQPPLSLPVPFNGYGRIQIRYDSTMTLPDGLLLPMSATSIRGTYQEGAL
ncbi:MAG: hypothetical protein ACI89L_002209 [Phycisphaerales bacterium]|jgi:hypothetical protein